MSESVIELDLAAARVAFSTRRGGISEGAYRSLNLGILTDDDPARVNENRSRLARGIGLDPAAVAMGWQVHGRELATWDAAPPAGEDAYATPGASLERVDGHVTSQRQLGLLVLVADCLPVALAGPDRVAMLHCGWRGLAAGIIADALERFEAPPDALVGPGIGRCCFEVGPEVVDRFGDAPEAVDGRMLDLRLVAEARLRAGGVRSVEHVDRCTACEPDTFFSHRRDAGVTGRQCGVAWLPA